MVELPRRVATLRHPNHDYLCGCYFVTAVTHIRRPILSKVRGADVALSPLGAIVDACWRDLAARFDYVTLHAHVVMPDHVHGLLSLGEGGAPTVWPLADRGQVGPAPASLGAVIGQFKSTATRRIEEAFPLVTMPIWQRGFHDKIVRNQQQFETYVKYIDTNPIQWWKKYSPNS
jgi:REP element-mobilizing transposase RayT